MGPKPVLESCILERDNGALEGRVTPITEANVMNGTSVVNPKKYTPAYEAVPLPPTTFYYDPGLFIIDFVCIGFELVEVWGPQA